MNCAQCGAVLNPGAQFCSVCGARAAFAPPPNYQPGAFAGGGVPPLPPQPPQPPPLYPPPVAQPPGYQPPGYPGAGAPYGGYAPASASPGQGIQLETDPRGQGRGFTYEV